MSTSKANLLNPLRKFFQCSLEVNEVKLKQVEKLECFGVAFIRNETQNKEIQIKTNNADSVMYFLQCCSVIVKRELSKKAKLAVFRSILFYSPVWT